MEQLCEIVDKRGVQRFDLRLHTVLHELDDGDNQLELYTRDISSDGAYLCINDPLPLDTPVELTFYLPVRKKIRSKIQTNGRVIRADEAGMAIRFESQYQILAV
jgi:hypothetical protein